MFSRLKIENCKLKIAAKQAGFTLTELLVVMAIATIITTTIVIQQNSWNDRLIVSTQAYEVALMIRQAQIYALAVREYPGSVPAGDRFNLGYGVFFDSTNPGQYIFYGDLNGNYDYDPGEEVEIKTFSRGVTIFNLCATKIVGQFDPRCAFKKDGTSGGNVSQIEIFFLRPEPEAKIKFLTGGGNEASNVGPKASVCIENPGKNVRFHTDVTPTGQITVAEQPLSATEGECIE